MPMHRLITMHHIRKHVVVGEDFWTLMSGNDIYVVTSVAPGGGSAISKNNWVSTWGNAYYAEGIAVGPSGTATSLMLFADNLGVTGSGLSAFARSTDSGASWSVTGSGVQEYSWLLEGDSVNPSRAWASNYLQFTSQSALAASVNIPKTVMPPTAALANYSDWRWNDMSIYAWTTPDGGRTWNHVFLDYLTQLLPIRITGKNNPITTQFFFEIFPADEGHICPEDGGNYTVATALSVTYPSANNKTAVNFVTCNLATSYYSNPNSLVIDLPSWRTSLAPVKGGDETYLVVGCSYKDDRVYVTNAPFDPPTTWSPYLPLVPFMHFGTDLRGVYLYLAQSYVYRIAADLSYTRLDLPGYILGYATADRLNSSILYALNDPIVSNSFNGNFPEVAVISGGGATTHAIGNTSNEYAVDIFCTTQNTLLVIVSATPNSYIMRSTDGGANWTKISPAALAGVSIPAFGRVPMAEHGGSVGGAVGTLAFFINTTGKYLFSTNDGVTWNVTDVLTITDYGIGNAAK